MSESLSPRDRLARGLLFDIPYFDRPLPMTGKPASVLALFGFPQGSARHDLREASLLLTRRTDRVETHKGQIALPGGHQDSDDTDELATALRETQEEVGIGANLIDVIGKLPVLWVRTGFLVTPVVGVLKSPIEETVLSISTEEIDEVFWAPVSELQSPEVYRSEWFEIADLRIATHVYQLGPHRVWGATGSIIKNILDRISALA